MLVAGSVLVFQEGAGDKAVGVTQTRSDTTTRAGVVGALEGTGYKFRYRKMPRLEEYEVVSGEAIHGDNRVEFTVEIRLAGPFDEIRKGSEENPQRPLLRYGRGLEAGDTAGNIRYATVQQAPAVAGHGFELKASRAQTRMSVKIGVALAELFAPKFQPGV